jgi:thiol-disulfide isomerase/thioredoxin
MGFRLTRAKPFRMTESADHSFQLAMQRRLTRRASLQGILASLAGLTLGQAAMAQTAEPLPRLEGSKARYTALDPAKPMPALKLFRANGKPAELAPKPGRVMLVNFWATWCDVCSKELSQLATLQKSLGKNVDIAAIANDGGGRAVVEPFLRKQDVKVLDIYIDPDGSSTGVATPTRQAGPFVLYATPMYYLITPQGRIAGYIPGSVDWSSDAAQALIAYLTQAE